MVQEATNRGRVSAPNAALSGSHHEGPRLCRGMVTSSAIQRATLPLVHRPPSGGGSSSRTRNRSSNSGFKNLARALIFAQIAQRRRADGVVAFEKRLNPTLTERGALRRLARRMALRQEKVRLKMP